jgi:hypothetical protein
VVGVVGENSAIASNFALVCVLADNGGVMIADYMAITEPMSWVDNLNNDINLRRGKRIPDIQVFGYFDPKASSFMALVDIEVDYEVEKIQRLSPGLRPYFLLAKKNTIFLSELIDEITAIVTGNTPLSNKDGVLFFGIEAKYELEYFTNAVHSLLQNKQKLFDSEKKKGEKTRLALDYYGLYCINELAALRKMWAIFDNKKSIV